MAIFLFTGLKVFPSEEEFKALNVFGMVYLFSIVAIMFMRVRFGEAPIPWSQDLDRRALGLVLVGLVGVLAVSTVATSFFFTSIIYVPRFSVQLASLPQVASDVVYQFTVVAPAEEFAVLAIAMGLYKGIPRLQEPIFALGASRLLWAVAHGYLAYGAQWNLLAAAFLAGLVMSYLMLETRSILTPWLIHGAYNSLIVLKQAGLL